MDYIESEEFIKVIPALNPLIVAKKEVHLTWITRIPI